MNLKKSLLAVAMLLTSIATFAQEDEYAFAPYWFIGAQGGIQAKPLNGNLEELITPHYGIQVGRQFSDVFGMRLQGLAYQSKGKATDASLYDEPGTYVKYNVWSAKWDLLFNITNIIAPKRVCKNFNWNVFLGAGVNGIARVPEYSDRTALHVGAGTQLEYLITRNIAVNLEVQANQKPITMNCIESGNSWQAVALLGLSYHFGHKKIARPLPPEPVYATRIDTIWYNDTEYKTKVVTEDITVYEHYKLRQAGTFSESTVAKVSDFMKNHRNVSVSVTGYADKGTGNAKLNMKYSQQRAEGVAKGLNEAGVQSEAMTVEWKGDTEQPFAENDQNRVAIIKATGECDQKYPVEVKKFRTQEVRYQVEQ